MQHGEAFAFELLPCIARELARQHRSAKWLMPAERQCHRHDGGFDFLRLVFRVLRVAPPCGFDKGDGHAQRAVCAAAFEHVVEVVLVAIAILPGDFRRRSRGSRAFVIKIEPVALGHVREDAPDERLEDIANDLAPTMRQ